MSSNSKYKLVIRKRMGIAKVEEVLTQFRTTNPSKEDETSMFLQLVAWMTIDPAHFQFGHLFKRHFVASNINAETMIKTFRENPALEENELIQEFYMNALQGSLTNIYHSTTQPTEPTFQQTVTDEAEKIKNTFGQPPPMEHVNPLEYFNAQYPCHPLNSPYNTLTPKFDPVSLFRLMKR